ncbi:T9SS type A sorting domain-containing protein [Panacibacter ginsenosidivorans]|uniref:T9SS type A sorting domain-containing protein n=1 Tax=Panacibacter ginsenosidivorans TaxID=1813871 RepID=UPI0013158781|nr:T9SS type A sorting domain-containing protein [Panacibacter ginsenosidivorans]
MKTVSAYLLFINCALLGSFGLQSNTKPGTSTVHYTHDLQTVCHHDALPVSEYTLTDTAKAVSDAEPVRYKKPPRPLKIFDLYPNPANKIIYIHITGKQTVTLHNEEGKLIFRTAIREKATVNLSPLPAGNYILTDEKTGTEKKFSIVR